VVLLNSKCLWFVYRHQLVTHLGQEAVMMGL